MYIWRLCFNRICDFAVQVWSAEIGRSGLPRPPETSIGSISLWRRSGCWWRLFCQICSCSLWPSFSPPRSTLSARPAIILCVSVCLSFCIWLLLSLWSYNVQSVPVLCGLRSHHPGVRCKPGQPSFSLFVFLSVLLAFCLPLYLSLCMSFVIVYVCCCHLKNGGALKTFFF